MLVKSVKIFVVGNVGINRIACCSRNVGDNHTVLLCQLVNEGGLADIRLTDDRNLRALVLLLVLRIVRDCVKVGSKSTILDDSFPR